MDDFTVGTMLQCLPTRWLVMDVSFNFAMSAGNNRAAYMREYRKRKRLEEDNCNNVPKRTKLHAERESEYTETHKNLSAGYVRN
jgi:hypothetical protein